MVKKHVQLVRIEIDGILVDAKACTKCGEVKPLSDYHKQKACLGGRTSQCKYCVRKKQYESRYGKGCYVPVESVQKTVQLSKVVIKGESFNAKPCNKCNEIKVLEDFRNDKKGLAGKGQTCKVCQDAMVETYRKNNPEKAKKWGREWARKKRSTDPEFRLKCIEANRKHYHKYKEKYAERYKEYYEENKEYHLERRRKYYYENWEQSREINKQWFKDNPERAQVIGMRRRTREALLPDEITPEEVEGIKLFFGGCALTGETEDIHLDHVIPLATGRIGAVYGNIIPLKSSLNESKRDKNIFEWFEQTKGYWGLSQDKFNKLIDYLAVQNGMSVEEYKDYVYWCHENPVQMDIDVENGIVQLSLL